MQITYTVRPMHEWLAGNKTPAGCNVVVRKGTRVLHQFPRMPNERVGHKLAQMWIKRFGECNELH